MTPSPDKKEALIEMPPKEPPPKAVLKEAPPKAAPAKAAAPAPKAAAKPAAKAKPTGSTGSQTASLLRSMLNKIGIKPIEKAMSTMAHVPSGSIIINNLIGGSKTVDGKGSVCPGYPRRKITEIYGPESSGKTTVALAAAADVQRKGGSVLYLDFEHALHHGYAQQIGVKFDDTWTLAAPDTMEEGFKAMFVGIASGVDLIIVDSIAAMVPKDELEKKIDDVAKIGAVAKKMSETLPKFALWLMKHPMEGTGDAKKSRKDAQGTALIFLNQERSQISTGGGHGAPEPNTAGGKALKYFAYVRLRLARISSEMIERKDPATGKKKKFPYGNVTAIKLVKSKADAKQGHSGNIFIRYGYGVDDVYSVIESGVATGVFKRDGAYYEYEGERFQGRDKMRSYMLSNGTVFEKAKKLVAEALIAQAPTAISDEELSDEDAILEDLAGAFGDEDDNTSDPKPVEVTLDPADAADMAALDDDSDSE
jgi:recombination protein RecA